MFGKIFGNKPYAWLFLSYDLDAGEIRAVRRVSSDDPQWADWNRFVREQVERCMVSLADVPNERIYAFRFNNLEKVPYLQGGSNNHYIEFVAKSVPVYQLGILEAAYAVENQIPPTELRSDAAHYDGFNAYIGRLQLERDMMVFERTVRTDSENYGLLFELASRYTDVPEVTERQIEVLNASAAGLRIFSVLEQLYRASDYVTAGWDIDDYEQMIFTPVERRTGLHYLKAELDKVDIQSGRLLADDPHRNRYILELTLFVRRFEIPRGWETTGLEREWFSACTARMTDAEMIAREIRNFAYVPALTKAQLQYLMRTGTTAETLFQSGIMGDVVMETPYFDEEFGLDMSGATDRRPEPLDLMLVESSRRVVESSLDWLRDVVDDEEETAEARKAAKERIPVVEGFLQNINDYLEKIKNQQHTDDTTKVLGQLEVALGKCSAFFLTHPWTPEPVPASGESEVMKILTDNRTGLELGEQQAKAVLEAADNLPVECLAHCLTALTAQVYGKLPEHQDLTLVTLLGKPTGLTVLQQLALNVERRQMEKRMKGLSEELAELRQTERRIRRDINRIDGEMDEYRERCNRVDEKLKQNIKIMEEKL